MPLSHPLCFSLLMSPPLFTFLPLFSSLLSFYCISSYLPLFPLIFLASLLTFFLVSLPIPSFPHLSSALFAPAPFLFSSLTSISLLFLPVLTPTPTFSSPLSPYLTPLFTPAVLCFLLFIFSPVSSFSSASIQQLCLLILTTFDLHLWSSDR